MNNIDFSSKNIKLKSILLFLFMLAVYLLENSRLVSIIGSQLFLYIIKPLLWSALVIIVWCFPRLRAISKLRHTGMINWWALNFSVIYAVVSFLAGLIDGFGKSPYGQTPRAILINTLFVGSVLVGREFIRAYIVNSIIKKENYLAFIIIAFVFTILSISYKRYENISDLQGLVEFIAQYLAPEIAQNMMATYLAFLGGALPALIYMGGLQAFHWFSPILPNLKWITAALIGVLVPLFSMMSMQSMYEKESKQLKKYQEEEGIISWMVTCLLSITIIWFVVGVFPVYPSAIATGSMEPMIKPGDVILVSKITDMEGVKGLKIGDVIQFKRDSILISHRIIDIVEEKDSQLSFKTKGDNNSSEDSRLVKPEEIRGKIIKVVPKLGWPTILVKQKNNSSLEGVQF